MDDMTPNQHLPDLARLSQFSDQVEIRSVVERYFYGLDARDADILASCFAVDASVEINTGGGRRLTLNGGEEIANTLVRLIGRFEASIHLGNGPLIRIDHDQATADTFAVARMAHGKPTEAGTILVRGLRYRDSLVKEGGAWRIRQRHHQTLWQYNAQSIEPFVPPAPGIG